MADWTVFDFIDQLETGLAGRAAFTALTPTPKVFTYWPAEQEFTSDMVLFGYQANDTKQEEHIGPSPTVAHGETVTVQGQVAVARPDSSTAVTDARTRAQALLGHLDAELRESTPTVGTQTVSARLASRQLAQFAESGVRFCTIEFTITYTART